MNVYLFYSYSFNGSVLTSLLKSKYETDALPSQYDIQTAALKMYSNWKYSHANKFGVETLFFCYIGSADHLPE